MSENKTPNHSLIDENRRTFMERLLYIGYSSENIRKIMYAYDMAKTAHRAAHRDNGERYFEHPRRVALAAIEFLHNTSEMRDHQDDCANTICIALLHDTAEDTPLLGNTAFYPKAIWRTEVFNRIAPFFGSEVAQGVVSLSKSKYPGMFETEDEMKQNNHEDVEKSSKYVTLVKACDRYDNLTHCEKWTKPRKEKYFAETRDWLLPLIDQKFIKDFSWQWTNTLRPRLVDRLAALKQSTETPNQSQE